MIDEYLSIENPIDRLKFAFEHLNLLSILLYEDIVRDSTFSFHSIRQSVNIMSVSIQGRSLIDERIASESQYQWWVGYIVCDKFKRGSLRDLVLDIINGKLIFSCDLQEIIQ